MRHRCPSLLCRSAFVIHAFAIVAVGFCASPVLAAEPPAPRVEAIQTPELVAVGFADFDLLQARYAALETEFALLGADGKPLARHKFDLHSPVARPFTVMSKPGGAACGAVAVALRANGRTVFEQTLPLPPSTAPADCPALSDARAVVLPGASKTPIAPALRDMRLPDYAKAPAAKFAVAGRTVDVAKSYRRVRCDKNYPIAAAQNNSFLGRQTAAPDDPKKRSMYISLRSQLFDPETAAYIMDAKYLAELQFDPAWLMPALTAEGDSEVAVPLDHLRLHWSDKKVDGGALGNIYMTGQRIGGLMQIIQSVVQDDAGNIYFATDYRGCIRLNIHTNEWEAMPADIYQFAQPLLPKMADLPYAEGVVTGIRLDFATHIYHHDGRIYIGLARDAIFGTGLTLAALFSVPTTDWDNPAKFREQMRFITGSWPTAPHPLFDTWVKPNEMTRKLLWLAGAGKRLYMVSYHANYLWAIDLNDDGSTRRVLRFETVDGKRVERFHLERMLLDPRQPARPLGVTLQLTLAGEPKPRTVFLSVDGDALTVDVPKGVSQPWHYANRGPMRGENQYGVTTFDKRSLAYSLGWPADQAKPGKVDIYYDALGAMSADREHLGFVLDRISRYSLSPGYHLATPPGEKGRTIGIAEYGYYQAWYDTAHAAAGYVDKRFLPLDTGGMPADLPVAIGLGAYSHQWLRQGDETWLYYVGYTGITRMLYARAGKPLDKFKMENLHYRLKMDNVDTTAPSDIKWYRDLNPGLDGKFIMTGVHQANRGGSPYSNGLIWFDTAGLDAQHKLSEMSRSYSTGNLEWRLVFGAGDRPRQEIYVGGNFSETYEKLLPADRVPPAPRPKLFLYEDDPAAGIRDRCAVTLASDAEPGVSHIDHRFAPDQVHLLVLLYDAEAKGPLLACLDPTAGRFTDVCRPTFSIVGFERPSQRLFNAPDGRVMLLALDRDDAKTGTFMDVQVDAAGKMMLRPWLTLKAEKPDQLEGSAMTFVPDARGDGSYDMIIGGSTAWNRLETSTRVIDDFIPARIGGK